MANINDKILDVRYKSIFHIRIDTAEGAAVDKIIPEALFGAVVKLTVPTGGTNYTIGENVSQATTGATGKVIGLVGDTEITISTGRDSGGVFTGASNVITGETSGAAKTPSVKDIPVVQRVAISTIHWQNFGFTGANDKILFQWDADVAEDIIALGSGGGTFELPSASIDPAEIAGLTGNIKTIVPTLSANSLGSVLIEVHKKSEGYFYPDNS